MVLTPPMVFAQTDGIESLLLNHTHTRGPSVTRMRDFFLYMIDLTKVRYLPIIFTNRIIAQQQNTYLTSIFSIVSLQEMWMEIDVIIRNFRYIYSNNKSKLTDLLKENCA